MNIIMKPSVFGPDLGEKIFFNSNIFSKFKFFYLINDLHFSTLKPERLDISPICFYQNIN